MSDLATHIKNPSLYFQKYDFSNGTTLFREMTRASFQKSSFLDDRLVSPNPNGFGLTIDQAMAAAPKLELPPSRIIFHTAYCCSTLLSRALDIPGRTMVYREPVHLHHLAAAKRRKPGEIPPYIIERWPEFFHFSLSMLSKKWAENEITIVKPTDACNNIITDILALHQGARAILLYSQAREFLVSNLKSEERRQFLNNFIVRSVRENAQLADSVLHAVDVASLSLAESAAYVWMTQVQSYRKALSEKGDQCLCLDAATLLADTHRVLTASAQFLELGLSEADLETAVNSEVWRSYAKDTSKSYSSADRQREMSVLSKDIETEIQVGLAWIEQFNGGETTARFERELDLSVPA